MLGRIGDNHCPQPITDGVELVTQDVDDSRVLGPGDGSDGIHRGSSRPDTGIGQVQPETSQQLACGLPVPPALRHCQEPVMSVPPQEPELIVKIEQVELGQERDNSGAQSRTPVAACPAQQRCCGRGQQRVGVETRDDPTHQFVLLKRLRCRGDMVVIRPTSTRQWPRLAPVTWSRGRHGRGDDLKQVVDAVGAQQQLAHPVMELLSGGSQELRLLRGREREPGQLTAGGEVTGADDGRNRNLSVDVAQERTITAGRPVLTRGLSGRQADERGGQAGPFQTPYEVVDDDGPVGLEVVALVEDDGGDSRRDECVQACPGTGPQNRVDGIVVELIDLTADGGSA